MSDVIVITDSLIASINHHITMHPPERGGALMSAGGLIHHVVPDLDGDYTAVSWDISEELTLAVQVDEKRGRGTLAGTVHSHPSGTPDPSTPDILATARLLDANPHLTEAVILIVSSGQPRSTDLAVTSTHRLSAHLMRRARDGHRVRRVGVRVVPVAAATGADAAAYYRARLCGVEHLAVFLGDDLPTPVAALFSPMFPLVAPVIALPTDGQLEPLRAVFRWDPSTPDRSQIYQLACAALQHQAHTIGERTEGLSGDLRTKHVVVAGAGSVGSQLVEALVRVGVGRLTVIDPDTVSNSNLARSVYGVADVGRPKTVALANHLATINPAVGLTSIPTTIAEAVASGDLSAALDTADLVVAATDHADDQSLLSHYAYWRGVRLIACALYRQAAAGEVIIVDPSRGTACWRCSVGNNAANDAPHDYGSGTLVAELALGPSIGLVTTVATQLAIGLLAGADRPAGQGVQALVESGRTMGIVTTSPDWGFFPTVFSGLESHQFAPQSVWMRVEGDPLCLVCGSSPEAPPDERAGARIVEFFQGFQSDADGHDQNE